MRSVWIIYIMLDVKICRTGSVQVGSRNHCLEMICMLMYIISCLMRYVYCRRGCSETPLPVYVLEKSFDWFIRVNVSDSGSTIE